MYGQYRNRDAATLKLLKGLTSGKFEFGAIGQEVLRSCWSRGYAPTYVEFAQLWQRAVTGHSKPNPEWAFLTDLARRTADAGWKTVRARKAKAVISLLTKIDASPAA